MIGSTAMEVRVNKPGEDPMFIGLDYLLRMKRHELGICNHSNRAIPDPDVHHSFPVAVDHGAADNC